MLLINGSEIGFFSPVEAVALEFVESLVAVFSPSLLQDEQRAKAMTVIGKTSLLSETLTMQRGVLIVLQYRQRQFDLNYPESEDFFLLIIPLPLHRPG